MPEILLLPADVPPADLGRCRDLVDFLRRRQRVEGFGEPAEAPPAADPAEALLRLAASGRLTGERTADGTVELFHLPSRAAAESVLQAGDTGFPEPLQKKHAAAFRASDGALFRFPPEHGDGEPLEVFITDWSPCPAACAVAVHRGHAWAAHPEPPEGPWFTGRHVRHPLTGDLLPVWVAGWVRPDFGTGAVLVNPAHDPVDLAFGRAIGLPIRFALVPSGYDGSPATWPAPPLVRTGQTIRTGPYDGLSPAEAAGRYFDHLAAHGLAERHRDLQPGRQRLGRLLPDREGGLAWSPGRVTVVPATDGAPRLCPDDAGLLSAVLSTDPATRPLLVCPAGEQVQGLLALRLLWFDLTGRPLLPAAVHPVQKVQETKVDAAPEVARLAAWLGAPLPQVAVVKQQTVEQVQRFLRLDRELRKQEADGAHTLDEEGSAGAPALAKVKAAIRETDPAKAFTLLLQAQKQLLDLPADRRAGALPAYLVLVEVLTGRELPPGLPARQVWERL